jgi:hypothetical protein
MRSIPLLCLLLFASLAQAAVYKWVDENGKVHYSDEPQGNAEIVDLKDTTQNQIRLETPARQLEVATQEKDTLPGYKIDITSPEEEATIRNNAGEFQVIASIEPELSGQHLLVLRVDGKVAGAPQTSPIFALKGIERGQHRLLIQAITRNGKVLASSAPRTLYLHQAAQFSSQTQPGNGSN